MTFKLHMARSVLVVMPAGHLSSSVPSIVSQEALFFEQTRVSL